MDAQTKELLKNRIDSANDKYVEEYEKSETERLKNSRLTTLENHYKSESGVPAKYIGESLETYKPRNKAEEEIQKRVKSFAESPGTKTFIFCGANGTGKTHLACGIIRSYGGIYRTMQRLLYEVDSMASFRATTTKIGFLDSLVSSPLIVLDEIGRGVQLEAQQELACYLICERYAALKPTVLVSNLTKPELINYLGVAVKDRLNETCEILEFTGQSYRGVKRNEIFLQES